MPAALRRDCLHAVLGVARQRSDQLRRVDGGTPSTFRRPNSTLIAPPERTNIANGRCAVSLSYHLRNTTRSCIKVGSGQVSRIRFGADRVGLIQIGTFSECHFSLV
jgi:hypothetical protein